MHVALTYNLKREDSDGDPSSTPQPLPLPDSQSAVLSIRSTHHLPNTTLRDTFAEWDSVETITAVQRALELHHQITLVEAGSQVYEKLAALKPDFVFNMAEGLKGPFREAQIPTLLELLGIPYTGSDPLTLAICLDKARTKEILSFYRIPTAPFFVVPEIARLNLNGFEYPLIVKPLHEGSSKGILNSSVVRSPQSLKNEVFRVIETYDEPALVERYLPGREFTVALLGNGKELRVLPIIESKFDDFPPDANPINSFEAKWVWDTLEHPMNVLECPALIPLSLQLELEKICRRTFDVLRCRDWCRIDLRLDANGVPNVLEVNPIPGVLPNPSEHSFFPTAAAAARMSYAEMINEVLKVAVARYQSSNSH